MPAVSVNNSLSRLAIKLNESGYNVLYYNTSSFEKTVPKSYFRSYPDYPGGYCASAIQSHTSYFDFGEILLDTTNCLIDFLLSEVATEKPDFILHSHLAPWGKYIGRHFNIPAVCLSTTFIMKENLMLPQIREMNRGKSLAFSNVSKGVAFYQKCLSIHMALGIAERPNIWDIYVNEEDLNICFIVRELQPSPHLLKGNYHFVGFPMKDPLSGRKDRIYVSLGTIMNDDVEVFRTCLDVLADLPHNATVSIGSKIDPKELGTVPKNVEVCSFVDQRQALADSLAFISRGGMASVHESIFSRTPLIIIPQIPEQKITGATIDRLGIGICIKSQEVARNDLKEALKELLADNSRYVKAIDSLLQNAHGEPAEEMAIQVINRYLSHAL